MRSSHEFRDCYDICRKSEGSFNMSNVFNPARTQSIQPQTRVHGIGIWANFEGRKYSTIRFFFILGCLFSIAPILNSVLSKDDNKDYSHWYLIGNSVLAGESLYGDVRSGEPEYMYPPTAAVLFYAPLSNLNHDLFVMILCMITSISWAFCIWAANVLVTGKWSSESRVCAIGPGLAVAPYVWDIQLLGQTNLLLLALTLWAFLMLRSRRFVAAGWLLGTAVAMKAFPLSAIAYFIVRRKWTSVFATIISIVGLVWFFPGIVRGFERNTTELKRWTSLMLLDQSGETMSGRSSIGFTRRNQSLVSVSHRLLRPVNAGDNPNTPGTTLLTTRLDLLFLLATSGMDGSWILVDESKSRSTFSTGCKNRYGRDGGLAGECDQRANRSHATSVRSDRVGIGDAFPDTCIYSFQSAKRWIFSSPSAA